MKTITEESDYGRFILKDGIIYCHFKKNIYLNKEVYDSLHQMRIKMTKTKSYPLILIDEGIKGMGKYARDQMSSSKVGLKGVSKAALVLPNRFSYFLAHFFLTVSYKKKIISIKIFERLENAEKWIRETQ